MIDFSKVFPRLKEASNESVPSSNALPVTLDFESSPVIKPFVEGLVITYAVDLGAHYQFVANEALNDKLSLDILHKTAIDNMIKEISANLEIHGDPTHGVMITNGGNHEAVMLLVDGLWHQMQEIMEGEFYVAVPARDLLYVAPKSNPDAIQLLTSAIDKVFDDEDAEGTLVKHIYERDNSEDTWQLVATV